MNFISSPSSTNIVLTDNEIQMDLSYVTSLSRRKRYSNHLREIGNPRMIPSLVVKTLTRLVDRTTAYEFW